MVGGDLAGCGAGGESSSHPIIMVEVTCWCGGWGLGSGSGCSRYRSSSHGRKGWRGGLVGSDLLVSFFQIFLQDPNLIMHCVE